MGTNSEQRKSCGKMKIEVDDEVVSRYSGEITLTSEITLSLQDATLFELLNALEIEQQAVSADYVEYIHNNVKAEKNED